MTREYLAPADALLAPAKEETTEGEFSLDAKVAAYVREFCRELADDEGKYPILTAEVAAFAEEQIASSWIKGVP